MFRVLHAIPGGLLNILLVISMPTKLLAMPFLRGIGGFRGPFHHPMTAAIFLVNAMMTL